MPGPLAVFFPAGAAAATAAAGAWLAYKAATATLEVLKAYGSLSDEVIVTVRGNVNADKSRLYKMAASVAFGVARRWVPRLGGLIPPPGIIMMETDYAGNAVSFTLRYEQSLAGIYVAGPLAAPGLLSSLPVMNGPHGNISGGNFDFTVGFPGLVAAVPPLEFDGRPVLWHDDTCPQPDPSKPRDDAAAVPCPNPRPYGDLRSRGTLVELVYTALSWPGHTRLMTFNTSRSVDAALTGG